jgi:Tfp pilus assembly protein PilX
MLMTTNTDNLRQNEQGFASIVIALIMIIVLALLTVGFAQLARREQQSALDKQLAVQAFYAAESGINDAYKAISDGAITSTTSGVDTNPSQCLSSTLPSPDSFSSSVNPTTDVGYTCLMINLQPQSLSKDVAEGTAWTTVFSTNEATTNPIDLTINWHNDHNLSKTPKNGPSDGLSPEGTWSAQAVLQFSITPLSSTFDRSSLINSTFTAYLYPSSVSPNTVVYSNLPASQAPIVSGSCSTTDCSVTLTGIPSDSAYAINTLGYYDSAIVTITADDPASSTTPLKLLNSQAIIDATGQARNVLKRIEVTVPIHPPLFTPNYALEAQDICKRFITDPVNGTVPQLPNGYTGSQTDPCNLN